MTSLFTKWAKTSTFYHIIFWVSIASSFFVDIIEYFSYDIIAFSISILIRLILLFCLIYGNLYVLIPYLFNKKKYVYYWLTLILLTLAFAILYKAVYFKTTDIVFDIPQQGRYILNILLAIRFLFISYLFVFLKGWFDQEKKMNEMQIIQLGTELKYLRAQINPHFLFNTLNNIYGLAIIKSNKTPEAVIRLSEMMDYMLYDNNEEKVPLKKDIENLINYIELERIRQGNDAKIEFNIIGEPNDLKITPLLLLPLLENAFKHGINKEPINAFLSATIEIKQNSLIFSIANNKVSTPTEMTTNHSIGLDNLRKRLTLYYPDKNTIIINDTNKTFEVTLTIILS